MVHADQADALTAGGSVLRGVRRLLVAGGGLLLGALPCTAGSDCDPAPARLIELELQICLSAVEAVEEQLTPPSLWWMRPYMESVVKRTPGVVLRGTTTRYRRLATAGELEEWTRTFATDDLFLPSADPDLCEAFKDVEEALLVQEHPCCDTVPPVNTACLLGIDEARAPTGNLLRQLAPVEDARRGVSAER